MEDTIDAVVQAAVEDMRADIEAIREGLAFLRFTLERSISINDRLIGKMDRVIASLDNESLKGGD